MCAVILRWLSNQDPRFLADVKVGTLALRIVNWLIFTLFSSARVPITMNSVLSSLSFNLSTVIQVLISLIQF